MSRNVVISNLGPGSIKAEVQGRNARGHYEQSAEYEIKENTVKVLTLGAHTSLQIIEVEAGQTLNPPIV